ncbi:MAG: hypothetical protein E2O39_07465 [Planctomycetota bacterium]|nr:MAG: hypothetical protein E2O39_07465 [Planctomycetota bacterium]
MSSRAAHALPRLAVTVGDPAGIGPEIVLAAIGRSEVRAAARLLVVGPEALRPPAVPRVTDAGGLHDLEWLATEGPEVWDMGRDQAECGRAALAALRAGSELARSGRVDGLVTAPVSKRALHLAGEPVEGQTELLARWAGAERCEMLGIAGRLRVMLLTRHLPLRSAIANIDPAAVERGLLLLDETLRELGISDPRLALAGLNPHAGEGGLLGSEEGDILAPAVQRLRARGLDVTGPVSPDTVFLAASEGAYDGVLALYHDQAFIPLKLLSRDRGLTILAGLSYLRVSPVHGTAYDIAGSGRASAENIVQAILSAAAWAAARRTTHP